MPVEPDSSAVQNVEPPKPTEILVRPESTPLFTTYDELTVFIEEPKNRGLEVLGFGHIPVTPTIPPDRQHRAYRTADGAPDPDVLSQAIDFHRQFRQGDFQNTHLNRVVILAHKIARESNQPFTPQDATEIRTYWQQIVWQKTQETYQNRNQLYERERQEHLEKTILPKYEIREELAQKVLEETNENPRQSHLSQDWRWDDEKSDVIEYTREDAEIRQLAQHEYDRELADIAEKRAEQIRYEAPEILSWQVWANLVYEKLTRTSPDSPHRPILVAKLAALNILGKVEGSIKNEVSAMLDGLHDRDHPLRDLVTQNQSAELTQRIVQSCATHLKLTPDSPFMANLIEKTQAWVMSQFADPDGNYNSYKFLWNHLPQILAETDLPPEKLQAEFDQLAGQTTQTAKPHPHSETLANQAINLLHSIQIDYADFLNFSALQNPNLNVTSLTNAWDYFEAHRARSSRRLVDLTDAPFETGLSEEGNTHNTLRASPIFPSPEIAATLAGQETPTPPLPPNLESDWPIIAAMLEKNGVVPDIWLKWVDATTPLGRSGLTEHGRQKEMFSWLSWNRPPDQPYSFPSQDQIKSSLYQQAYPQHNHVSRNHAINTWRLVIPLRLDREHELKKYDFTPSEWLQAYDQFYRALELDYSRHPDSPESYAAALRTSIYAAIGGGHEQHYKSWDEFGGSGDMLDALDVLFLLPSIAKENNNDSGFYLLAAKLYLQLPKSQQILYAKEAKRIFTTIKEICHLNIDSANQHLDIGIPQSNLLMTFSGKPHRRQDFVETAIKVHSSLPDGSFSILNNINYLGEPHIHPEQWGDAHITINPKTGEFKPRNTPEVIFAGQETALARLHHQSPEVAALVEDLNVNSENSTLKPITCIYDIVQILTGERRPPQDISAMFIFFDQVNQAAAKLRGASRLERQAILDSLHEPLRIDQLTLENTIALHWLASGFLEREHNIHAVLTAATAALRISVTKIVLELEKNGAREYAAELQSVLGLGAKEAQQEAIETVGFGLFDAHQTLSQTKQTLQELTSAPDAKPDTLTRARRQAAKTIGLEITKLMDELASVTQYNIGRTTFLQVADQLFGSGDEKSQTDFLGGNGKLLSYCVQQEMLLQELVLDMMTPFQDASWHKPFRAQTAWEDERSGISLEKYYQTLQRESQSPHDPQNSFDHYFTFCEVPQIRPTDKPYYLLLDPTENKVRIFNDQAIVRRTDDQLLIRNSRTRIVSQGVISRTDYQGETKIVLNKTVAGQSLSPLADLMQGASDLKDYGYTLEANHPKTLFAMAADSALDPHQKRQALTTLLSRFPYFIGETEFGSPEKYFQKMRSILELSIDQNFYPASLFIARTLQTNLPPDQRDWSIVKSLIDRAGLLSEQTWEIEKQTWQPIILESDAKAIDALIAERKHLEEAERLAAARANKTTLRGKINHTISRALNFLQEILRSEPKPDPSLASQPGSKERFIAQTSRIDIHADIINKTLTLPAPPPEAEPKIIKLPQKSLVIPTLTYTPLSVSTTAAQQGADALLSLTTQDNLSQELEEVAAIWRAFIHDASNSHELKAATWETLNARLLAAITKRQLNIDTNQPLGDKDAVLALPKEVVAARITHNLSRQTPILGSAPSELPPKTP